MSLRLPAPSLLSMVTPQDWEHTATHSGVEIWRGRILSAKWDEPLRDKLYEASGGFRFLLSDWETNKLMAAIRVDDKIVSYAMLSQDGYYGTAQPVVKNDVCLGQVGVWTHPDYRLKGHGKEAMDGIFCAMKTLIGLTQGDFHVVWAQAHVAHYMRSVARNHLSDFEFDILSFERLEGVPRQHGGALLEAVI